MLLGANFAWAKKRGGIPADCYEVEWLKVPGGAYIDLDYYTGNKLRIVLKASFPSGTGEQDIIGNQDNTTGRFVLGTSGGKWFAYSRSASKYDANAWSGSYAAGDICDVEAVYDTANNVKSLSVNGTAATAASCTTVANTNNPMRVFRSTSGSLTFLGALYSLYMEKDGTPWYDLVPVRRVENGVSVGYLCNRLTGELHASGGAFVIGPDKYDAEVEYIQSHGGNGEWINTGITYSSYPNISFAGEFRECSSTANSNVLYQYGLFGVCEATNGNASGFRAVTDGILLAGGRNGYTTASVPVIKTARVTFSTSYSSETATINGADYSFKYTPSSTASIVPIGIFCYAAASSGAVVIKGGNFSSAAKCYYFKIYSNDSLVRDFIPVRYRSIGYLYDRVSGRLFGNQGSGEFVIGADVKYAKDYVQDGLVAMWDGIENAGWGVHDGDATVWKDLVGGVDAAKNGSVSFGVDFVSLAGGYFLVQEFAKSTFSNDYTIEVCLSRNESVTNAGVYSTNDDGLRSWISTYNGYYNFSAYVRRANVSVTNLLDVYDLKTFSVKADGSTAYSFKNGEQISSASASTSSYSGSTPLYLFRLDRYSNFKGRGHCVRIYNRALTPAEIAANYAVDKARFGI